MQTGGRKIRVAVSGHDLKFWYPLQRSLEKTGRYEFREDVWVGHESHDPAKSDALIEWADLLVAEWALGNAVYYSRKKRRHQRLVVRLHLQERNTKYPGEIDYANVNQIVFVGPHIQRECIAKFGIPPEICAVLGNFIDVAKYDLPKLGGAEFALGIIGTAPARKRLDLALDTLELLERSDDRYRLRVKGSSPASINWLWARGQEREYYEAVYARINSSRLRHKVIFDPQGNDVHHWLRMVGTVLSPSDFESFHMAVAEGAASGAHPIVWKWDGASEIYPEFPLVGTPREAAELIEFFNRSSAGPRFRKQAKNIISARYDSSVIAAKWDALLAGDAGATHCPAAAPAGGRAVLVLWAIDNWATFHRREMLQALAANVADVCDILVVEPGNHLETIEKLGWAPPAELARIAAGELILEGANIYRTRLLTGNSAHGNKSASFQGSSRDALVVLDRMVATRFPDADQTLHWVFKPDQAKKLGGRRFIIEVYDDYTIGFGNGEPDDIVKQLELDVLPRAEHVFFTSSTLMQRKAATARRASLVSNGVSYEAFARFRLDEQTLRAGQATAGYLGNLSDFFDWELMLEVCSRLPDVSFVFHGTIETAKLGSRLAVYEEMKRLKNVRFTGHVGRAQGAAAVNRYDVLLIPFVVNDAMHAVNPLKLWEYFATGRPVVTSPMHAIQDLSSLVTVAEGVEQWVAAIAACLQQGSAVGAEARIAAAEQHRWELLTQGHASVVRELIGGRPAVGQSVPSRPIGSVLG